MTARFVLTIDTEDFFLPRPPFDTYRAELDGRAYGVPLIMDLLEEQGGRGTFFVDVYNRQTVSEGIIKAVCQEIVDRGHEVALHTHPAFPSGQRGYGMAQTMRTLSLAEQTDFVRRGVDLIAQWTGTAPATHRAGGYGANYDTLQALAANGIFIDSSLFHGYPYCGLNQPPLAINRPVRWQGVLEVPITVTMNRLSIGVFGHELNVISMVKKIDPDWCSPEELRIQIGAAMAAGIDPIILFLHSYSLIDIARGFRPSDSAIRVLRSLLSHIRSIEGQLVTLKQAASTPIEQMPVKDSLPEAQMNLAGREWRTAFWLLKRIRPGHFKIWRQSRSAPAQNLSSHQTNKHELS